jgi:hypothetical protein
MHWEGKDDDHDTAAHSNTYEPCRLCRTNYSFAVKTVEVKESGTYPKVANSNLWPLSILPSS